MTSSLCGSATDNAEQDVWSSSDQSARATHTLGANFCSATTNHSTPYPHTGGQQRGPERPAGDGGRHHPHEDCADPGHNAIFRSSPRKEILMSRRKNTRRADFQTGWPKWATKMASSSTEALTVLRVLPRLCGFMLQFQGLRAMNWSASIVQLVCVFLIVWRAWVRRGMTPRPIP